MKKRLFALAITLMMVLGVAACGDKTPVTSNSASVSTSKEDTSTTVSVSKENVETPENDNEYDSEKALEYDSLLSKKFGKAVILDQNGNIINSISIDVQDYEAVMVVGDYLLMYKYEEVFEGEEGSYSLYAKSFSDGEEKLLYTGDYGFADYYNGKIYVYSYNYSSEKTTARVYEYGTFKELDASEYYVDGLGEYQIISGRFLTNYANGKCIPRIIDETGYLITYKYGEHYTFDGEAFLSLDNFGFSETICDYNSQYILFSYTNPFGDSLLCLYDQETQETEILTSQLDMYLGSDGTYNYFMAYEGTRWAGNRFVYRLDLKDGSKELVLTPMQKAGTEDLILCEGIKTIGADLYFLSDNEGVVCWNRVSQERGETLPFVIYEYPYAKYGRIEYVETIGYCEICQAKVGEGYSEYFIPDERITNNSEKIAVYLQNQASADFIDFGNVTKSSNLEECEAMLHGYIDYMETIENRVMNADIIGGHYLSVHKSGYWYGGMDHGDTIEQGYLFDLDTGDRVRLSDLAGISDGEFKAMVGNKIADLYRTYEDSEFGNPFFAETAEEASQQAIDYISLETANVVFNHDGVTVLFAPYVLSYYTSGVVEVKLSYVDLKISDME